MSIGKLSYMQLALQGLPSSKKLIDAVFYFYHAGVPLEDAKKYLKNLADKIASNR